MPHALRGSLGRPQGRRRRRERKVRRRQGVRRLGGRCLVRAPAAHGRAFDRHHQAALRLGGVHPDDVFNSDVEAARRPGPGPKDGHLLEDQDGARLERRRRLVLQHARVHRALHPACHGDTHTHTTGGVSRRWRDGGPVHAREMKRVGEGGGSESEAPRPLLGHGADPALTLLLPTHPGLFRLLTGGIVQDRRGVAARVLYALDARGKKGQLAARALAQHRRQVGLPHRVPR